MAFLEGFFAVIAVAGAAAWIWHSVRARSATAEQRAMLRPRAILAKLATSLGSLGLVAIHMLAG